MCKSYFRKKKASFNQKCWCSGKKAGIITALGEDIELEKILPHLDTIYLAHAMIYNIYFSGYLVTIMKVTRLAVFCFDHIKSY